MMKYIPFIECIIIQIQHSELSGVNSQDLHGITLGGKIIGD